MRCAFVVLLAVGMAGCGGEGGGNPQARSNSAKNPPPVAINNSNQKSVGAGAAVKQAPSANPGGWGTLRGQIVFTGAKLPEPAKLDVTKDQGHCLSNGPIMDEKWVVNPANKGVRWAVVFLKPNAGQMLSVHQSLKNPITSEIVLDEPVCRFDPRVVALREGQKLTSRNSAPVTHNIVIQGFKNAYNVQIATGKSQSFNLLAEPDKISLSCGIHTWMKGNIWVFDHPYFAVTDADGKFEIPNAPSGPQNLVVWHEAVTFLDGKNGRVIAINPDAVTNLEPIGLKSE